MNNNTLSSIGLIVLMVIFMYFFMIRPQQKQRKAHQSMMSKLKKGDHVVTIGRLHGVVYDLNQAKHTVTLDCEGIYLTFDLSAIMRVTSQAAAESKPVENAQPAPKAEKKDDKAADDTQSSTDDDKSANQPADDAADKADDQEAK